MPVIHRLSEDVINKIAAGEVIQRPSAALKELLENALDAEADEINVTAADGGLTYLQVRDNGSGIRYDDLSLLCARHATSKLQSIDELQSITSFGFRGEALASLSYVAKVKVITRSRNEDKITNSCMSVSAIESTSNVIDIFSNSSNNINEESSIPVAWEAHYCNGELIGEPIPIAGNLGTSIIAENMFYNIPIRRRSVKPSEDWNRIREVVTKYAFAFPSVGFSVQRIHRHQIDPVNSSSFSSRIRVTRNSQELDYLVFPKHSSTRHNIQLVFTNALASSLHLISFITHIPHEHVPSSRKVNHTITEIERSNEDEQVYNDFKTETKSVNQDESTSSEWNVINHVMSNGKVTQALSFDKGMHQFAMWGYVTDTFATSNRKHYLCLFVNNRLVESNVVKRMLDGVYSNLSVNNHNSKYVVVINLYLPCSRVDINIHPTKQEVRMFDEQFIVHKISELVREMLSSYITSVKPLNTALTKGTGVTSAHLAALSSTVNLKSLTEKSEMKCKTEKDMCVEWNASSLCNKFNNKNSSNCNNSNTYTNMLNSDGCMKNTSFTLPPSCMVRIEPQKGALDRYLQTSSMTSNTLCEEQNNNVESKTTSTEITSSLSEPVAHATDEVSSTTHISVMKRSREEYVNNDNNTEYNESSVVLSEITCKRDKAEMNEVKWNEERKITEVELVKNNSIANISTNIAVSENDINNNDNSNNTSSITNFIRCSNSSESRDEEEKDDAADYTLLIKEFKCFQKRENSDDNNINNDILPSIADSNTCNSDKGVTDNCEFKETIQKESAYKQNSNIPDRTKQYTSQQELVDLAAVEETEVCQKDTFVLLTSVERLVQTIKEESSLTAQEFFSRMSFVGVVNNACFLVQVNTTLYIISTTRFLREAVYQRIFLRWASAQLSATCAPSFQLSTPLSVPDLLLYTLAFHIKAIWPPTALLKTLLEESLISHTINSSNSNHRNELNNRNKCQKSNIINYNDKYIPIDVNSLTPPSISSVQQILFYVNDEEYCNSIFTDTNRHECSETASSQERNKHLIPTLLTRKYVQRLTRQLKHWREMLQEYFGIVFRTSESKRLLNKVKHNIINNNEKKEETERLYLLALPAGLTLQWPPSLEFIPLFVWQLAERVPYPTETYKSNTTLYAEEEVATASQHNEQQPFIEDEMKCFSAIARCIANTLYSNVNITISDSNDDDEDDDETHEKLNSSNNSAKYIENNLESANTSQYENNMSTTQVEDKERQALSRERENKRKKENMRVQHVLLPCVQNTQLFKPPTHFLTDHTIQSIVSVETLYKIFERC